MPFFEAIRQIGQELPRGDVVYIHLTLIPYISSAGELKTKPTQHSVKELRSIGIQPDILMCRCDREVPESERKKIALFCNVRPSAVIQALDVASIYDVPDAYHKEGLDEEVLSAFGLGFDKKLDLERWHKISRRINTPDGEVTIAIVGKYTGLLDAYKSLNEALVHGGIANRVKVNTTWIEAGGIENEDLAQIIGEADGILVPGGFGKRGSEGKIAAVEFARTRNIPYFGICLGMQMAIVEAARNLAGIKGAGSSEFGEPKVPIVGLMTEWMKGEDLEKREQNGDLGGTMRVGAFEAKLARGSLIRSIYGDAELISERHRHRYEVDMSYREQLEKHGLLFAGTSPDGLLPETIELKDHPWFVGVQYHPELKSMPFKPHPLFASFIAAAVKQSRLV